MKKSIKRLIRKLGLLDDFSLELTISPQTLIYKISKKMDNYRPDLFDIFTFNKKEYKGFITTEKFEIKKCQSFIISFDHYAEAFGKIEIKDDKIQIRTEIYATDLYLKLAALGSSALIFTTIALLAITSTLTTGKIDGLYIGLIILIFESICFGLPFLAMRWSVQNLKSDLEDDLRNIRE